MISEILALFVDTLTADDKYPLCNRENLPQPGQMELSKKQKYFTDFFVKFIKPTSNLEYFKKNDEHNSFCISDIRDCKRRG